MPQELVQQVFGQAERAALAPAPGAGHQDVEPHVQRPPAPLDQAAGVQDTVLPGARSTGPFRRPVRSAMDLGLAGKHALVTGASKGIGLAITRALAAEGAHVVAGARARRTSAT